MPSNAPRAATAADLYNRRTRNNDAVSDTDDNSERPNAHDVHDAQPPLALPKQHAEHKLKKLLKRLLVGSSLLAMLVAVLSQGHLATLGLVLAVQVAMFRELVNVRYRARTVQTAPLFRTSQWGWFITCMLYSYSSAFSDESLYALLSPTNPVRGLLRYASFVTLLMYSLMLMVFVLTLRRGFYKHQVGQLAWTIATIVVTVVQVQAFTQNIFAGLFWFLYPVGLVICNDSMAYFCGLALGHKITSRPFLSISPNKTWEGFVGGGICTLVFAFFFPLLVVRYTPALACPCEHLLGSPLELKCALPEVFAPAVYDVGIHASLDSLQRRFLGAPLLPIQLHAIALGCFASFVAPFGGFFASGIKRAYNIKDFSALIPGHGGVFDRVDCQLIMGLATHIYYSTFIDATVVISRARLLQLIGTLSVEDQLILSRELAARLAEYRRV